MESIPTVYNYSGCRKEMEVTWNSRGEQYRAEANVMEDKLRNTEQAMMKVIDRYHKRFV